MDKQTHDDSIYRTSVASGGKKILFWRPNSCWCNSEKNINEAKN